MASHGNVTWWVFGGEGLGVFAVMLMLFVRE